MPLSPDYKLPFLELSVPSTLQTAATSLAAEERSVRIGTVKKVGSSLISAFILL